MTAKILVLDDFPQGNESRAEMKDIKEFIDKSAHLGTVMRFSDVLMEKSEYLFAAKMKRACFDFDLAVAFLINNPDANCGNDARLMYQIGFWYGRRKEIGRLDNASAGISLILASPDDKKKIASNIDGVSQFTYSSVKDLVANVGLALHKIKPKKLSVPGNTLRFIRHELPSTAKWPDRAFMESGYSGSKRMCDLKLQLCKVLAIASRNDRRHNALKQLALKFELLKENLCGTIDYLSQRPKSKKKETPDAGYSPAAIRIVVSKTQDRLDGLPNMIAEFGADFYGIKKESTNWTKILEKLLQNEVPDPIDIIDDLIGKLHDMISSGFIKEAVAAVQGKKKKHKKFLENLGKLAMYIEQIGSEIARCYNQFFAQTDVVVKNEFSSDLDTEAAFLQIVKKIGNKLY